MTEHERIEEEVHPVAMLLPWYQSGKLKEEEHRRVNEHLSRCPQCQRELEELTWLRAAVGTAYAEQPGPSPGLFGRVMERIEAEPKGRSAKGGSRAGGDWVDRLVMGVRSLYMPKWAPALASLLIIGQFALLLWTLQTQSVTQPSRNEQGTAGSGLVRERSVPPPASRIRVEFQPGATSAEIARLLEEVKGRIVDGPLPGGFFTIEIPLSGAANVAKVVDDLRTRTAVVRTVNLESE